MAKTITTAELRRLIESEIKQMNLEQLKETYERADEGDAPPEQEMEQRAAADKDEENELSEDVVLERWRRMAGLLKS